MSTIEKALDMLDLFSDSRPALGLSEAARLLNRDKASVLRYLNALENKGFLQKDPLNKMYHLGPAVVRLALVREKTYPMNRAATNVLQTLVDTTRETAHLTMRDGDSLAEQVIVETNYKGTRVYIDPAEPLPLHASASGLAVLAHMSDAERNELLSRPLERFTDHTIIDIDELRNETENIRARGFSVSGGMFEADVFGVAAPIFDRNNAVCGAVAVATPVARFDEDAGRITPIEVKKAARLISGHFGADLNQTSWRAE
ncbi:MAG: IclR family transcriptional regulator [Pikeienuella sp.]